MREWNRLASSLAADSPSPNCKTTFSLCITILYLLFLSKLIIIIYLFLTYFYRWLRLCVKSKDDTKLSEVFEFLNGNGRMKYVRPLYRDLYAWEEVRGQAINNFLKNEKNMMHVSAYTLRKDLHLSASSI